MKSEITSEVTNDGNIRLLEISATLASLIGLVGLIALMAHDARAESPKGGFQPGGRTFSNPFAPGAPGQPPGPPGPGGKNNFFDDDDEEDEDFPAPPPPPGGQNFGAPQGAAAAGFPPAGMAGGPGGAISMGGTGTGMIEHNRSPREHIDDDTGEGSKAVVTDFNFPDADIMDIAKTLGKLTGKNFILDKDVKGRITIISNSPITVGDAWKAFLTALDINGFALIPSGKYIRIARQRDARDKQLKTYTGDFTPDSDALITRVIPLKYINAEEVTRTFRSFMPANSRIIPYEQTNTIIITDTGSNIAKLAKMLEILDVEGYDAGIEVIPVKYASAAELSKLIDTLLPGTGSAPGGAPGAPRFGGGGGKFSARRTKEGGIINTIISDERTNTLIVHANSKGADQVRELIAKLDQRLPVQKGGGKVHVVYLQFAEAEQIANTLNNLSQGGGKSSSPAGGGTGVNPVAASLFEGNIKISADKATNALVITASPTDFETVQRVIYRLDIPRDEVYVEVVIMEVSLAREFDFSTNVINPASGLALTTSTDLFDFIANPISQKGAIIGFASGSPRTLQIGSQSVTVSSVQGLVKAIQANSNANVLASPQILAIDNEEANFESAEKIPVPTTTAVQGAGVSTSVTKESVSLSVKIKPQINKMSNFVKLKVIAKLADISGRAPPAQVQGLAFATVERNADTTVVVGDSDTVVIGGLTRDKINEKVTKIPLLGDIPLLGWLFRSKNTTSEKTNLLMFLTPHIVRQYEKVRAILDKKLKERDDFIEANAGGNDPLRSARDEMIRGLPDIHELTSKKPESTVTIDEDRPAAVPVNTEGNPFSAPQGSRESGQTPQRPAVPENTGAGPVNTAPPIPVPAPEAPPVGGSEAPPPAPPPPNLPAAGE